MTKSVSNDETLVRRELLRGAMLAATGGLLIGTPSQANDATTRAVQKKAFHPEGAPAADPGYSPALLASGQQVLFISGQGPNDINVDMETQIRQTFERIGILLKAAGASFENVVFIRSFWLHVKRDLPIFRKVRREFLVEPYPASTAIGVAELAKDGLELEIDAVALL
jgi:2-iminobutanoate/2-iminopropanoate deaminase